MGRRPAASRGFAPAGGLSSGIPPPFLFWYCQKRNGPYPQGVCRIRKRKSRQRLRDCTVQREKTLGRAPVQWPSALTRSTDRCLLRFGPAFGHARVFCEFATAVPWRMVRRSLGWLSHCLCFSFRCRSPSGHRGLYQRADRDVRPYRAEGDQPSPAAPRAVGRAGAAK